MQKTILFAFVLSLALNLPVQAETIHQNHHGAQGNTEAMPMDMGSMDMKSMNMGSMGMGKMDMGKIDIAIQQLQDLRQKIEAETDAAAKKELLTQHLKMMQEGLNLLTDTKMSCMMMGSMGDHKMMDHQPTGATETNGAAQTVDERLAALEKTLATMEKSMGQGGMMSHGGMGQSKMTCMMEKRMGMLQEILNGLVLQQKLTT